MIINGWEKLDMLKVYHPAYQNDIYGAIYVDFYELGQGKYKGKVQTTLTDEVLHFELKHNHRINLGGEYILESKYSGSNGYSGSMFFPIEDVALPKVHRFINAMAASAFGIELDKRLV
jgi:hypothetical protein